MTTTAAAKAQEMLDQVKTGKTLFTRTATGWMIVGPAAAITSGAQVVVTKADGSTKTVVVRTAQTAITRQDVTYRVATFGEVTAAPAVARPAANPATPAQAALIVKLLISQIRSGETAGFMTTDGLIKGGNVDLTAVQALTAASASALIDSLSGSY